MPIEGELRAQLTSMSKELDRRTAEVEILRRYDEGGTPIPQAVERGKLTKAYRALMPSAEAPWGSLIIDSVQDRLEASVLLDSENESGAKAAWGLWQDNAMDAESKLAHRAALADGRAHALVWNDPDTGLPTISLDDCTQMVVAYRQGSRRHRVAALRRWVDGKDTFATLYRRDGIHKFIKKGGQSTQWERREVTNEEWPLRNPLETIPVVELAVNRRLKPGQFAYARGEYQHCTGLMDRINLLTFFGLVVALWMGFPLRGIIGDVILRDDDNKPLPPIETKPDGVFQLENPEAKVAEFSAADRKNLSIFEELEQLAAISKTPKHYFPMAGGISNIAEPTIRAFEGALHAKVADHKASLGEGWEEVLRLCGQVADPKVIVSPRASLDWKDHESRSLGERADAFVKLTSGTPPAMPPLMAAELALNLTGDQLARWQATQMGSVFDELLRAEVSTSTQGSTPAEESAKRAQPQPVKV